MKALKLAVAAAVLSTCASQLAFAATDLSSARRSDVYSAKKAQCKAQAKQKNFGVHFLKRNRWVKNCIAS